MEMIKTNGMNFNLISNKWSVGNDKSVKTSPSLLKLIFFHSQTKVPYEYLFLFFKFFFKSSFDALP